MTSASITAQRAGEVPDLARIDDGEWQPGAGESGGEVVSKRPVASRTISETLSALRRSRRRRHRAWARLWSDLALQLMIPGWRKVWVGGSASLFVLQQRR